MLQLLGAGTFNTLTRQRSRVPPLLPPAHLSVIFDSLCTRNWLLKLGFGSKNDHQNNPSIFSKYRSEIGLQSHNAVICRLLNKAYHPPPRTRLHMRLPPEINPVFCVFNSFTGVDIDFCCKTFISSYRMHIEPDTTESFEAIIHVSEDSLTARHTYGKPPDITGPDLGGQNRYCDRICTRFGC